MAKIAKNNDILDIFAEKKSSPNMISETCY